MSMKMLKYVNKDIKICQLGCLNMSMNILKYIIKITNMSIKISDMSMKILKLIKLDT